MPGFLDTIASAIGKPGRKPYKTDKNKVPPFQSMELKEKLQTIVFDKRILERERRQRMNLTYYLCSLYYRGFQQIGVNTSGGIDVFEDQDFYVENQFRRHVDTVVQLLNKMDGDVVVRPASDSPKDIATARVADPILDMQRSDIGYEKIRDEKNLYKCLMGNAFTFTDYLTDHKYGSIVTPKYSYDEVDDPTGEVMPNGSAPPPMLSKTVSGYEKRPKGRQVATVCTPLEINIPTEIKLFTEVPFLQWISRQDRETVEYLYPDLSIEGSMSGTEIDIAQQYIETLGNLPGNVLGGSTAYSAGSGIRDRVELVRSWLKPCTFRGDKSLIAKFPDGVHVVTVNGSVVDYYAEDLCDRWTHEVLIPVPHSLLGDGLYDAILLQDQINTINSLLIRHTQYTTMGKNFYDSNIIDSKDLTNDPANAWVQGKPTLDRSIREAVLQIGPTALSQDVPAWLNLVEQRMADMTGAYDAESGKSTGANSPYSQSVFLSEKAQGRWRGSHDYNYPERIRFHVQLLEDARTNWLDLRQRAVMDNTGQWSFQQFSSADLQGDVDITMSDSDFKPKTRAEQVQGLTMLTTIMPILPTLPPKQKLRIEEMLGLPPDANPMSNQISRAYRNIDRIKKGETVTPLPMVDDASMQVPVYADFLVSEEGEALAEAQPEIYANVYTMLMTLTQMALMQMNSPAGAQAAQIVKPQPQTEASKGGSPQAQPPGQPGGQMGQKGGGPGSAEQPAAQSPVQPAPPVSPPSPV